MYSMKMPHLKRLKTTFKCTSCLVLDNSYVGGTKCSWILPAKGEAMSHRLSEIIENYKGNLGIE